MAKNDIDNTKNKLVETFRILKNLNLSLWLIFSCFITVAVLYLVRAILSFVDINSSMLLTIVFRLISGLLAASGLALLIGLFIFVSHLNFFKNFCNIPNSKLPLLIVILSFITPIYYLASSFGVRFILLMLYDGTDYSDLQDLTLTITTPITYLLSFVLFILIIIMFARIGESLFQKKKIIITAVLLLPITLVGLFFNHLLLYGFEINGLSYFFITITLESSNYWIIALPYMVLFFLLAGLILEIYFYLKYLTGKYMIITEI